MEAPIKTRYDKAGPQVAEALRRRHFEAHYVSTAQEALELALTLIPKDRTVSWGGTATAAQIGLMDRLHQGDYQLIDRDTGKTPEEKQALMRQALTCGTFIMSSNAISADGQLVNIDGNANRMAALCFGPESVLVIAGMNKVMGDLDSAIARARQVAAPANAQRFDIKTPCAVTGSCGDCTSPDCICCQMVITRACRPAGRIKVILVGERLGQLIGHRGETLDAIQQLTNYAINTGSDSKRVRVQMDAENYRARREQSLESLARKVATKVQKYRRSVTLEPMNAYERHVIHAALQDVPGVTTYSVGTEPNRRVVVSYDRAQAR